VQSAYGLMLFANKAFQLPVYDICNGEDTKKIGTSVCQSMNGLRQRLMFSEQVFTTANPSDGSGSIPKPCSGKFIDAYTFEYESPLSECMVVFMGTAKPHAMHVHLAYGFNKDIYRSNP